MIDDYSTNNYDDVSTTNNARKYSDFNPPTTITSGKDMEMSPIENTIAKDQSLNLMTFYHPHKAEGKGKTSFDSRYKIDMPAAKKKTSVSPEFRQKDNL